MWCAAQRCAAVSPPNLRDCPTGYPGCWPRCERPPPPASGRAGAAPWVRSRPVSPRRARRKTSPGRCRRPAARRASAWPGASTPPPNRGPTGPGGRSCRSGLSGGRPAVRCPPAGWRSAAAQPPPPTPPTACRCPPGIRRPRGPRPPSHRRSPSRHGPGTVSRARSPRRYWLRRPRCSRPASPPGSRRCRGRNRERTGCSAWTANRRRRRRSGPSTDWPRCGAARTAGSAPCRTSVATGPPVSGARP